MISKFDNNIFLVRNVCQYLTLLIISSFLVHCPVSHSCSLNLIQHSNMRELILILLGLPHLMISIGFGMAVAIVSFLSECVNTTYVLNNDNFKKIASSISFSIDKKRNILLDLSNSFLYSDKTQPLLE